MVLSRALWTKPRHIFYRELPFCTVFAFALSAITSSYSMRNACAKCSIALDDNLTPKTLSMSAGPMIPATETPTLR